MYILKDYHSIFKQEDPRCSSKLLMKRGAGRVARRAKWALSFLGGGTGSCREALQNKSLLPGGTLHAWPEKGEDTLKDVGLAGHVEAPLKKFQHPRIAQAS